MAKRIGGVLFTGGGDPLTGELLPLEQAILGRAGGLALFLVTEEMRDLAEAWREVYRRALQARETGVLVLKKRAVAEDRALAERVAEAPLVWLASGDLERFLDLLAGSRLAAALARVVAQGGVVGAFGATSGVLGATAVLPREEGLGYGYGLGLLPGVVAMPGFERPRGFLALAEATAAQPDLTGLGLVRGSAVWVSPEGEAWVSLGRVARLAAEASEVRSGSIRNLSVDLLAAGARFKVPAYRA